MGVEVYRRKCWSPLTPKSTKFNELTHTEKKYRKESQELESLLLSSHFISSFLHHTQLCPYNQSLILPFIYFLSLVLHYREKKKWNRYGEGTNQLARQVGEKKDLPSATHLLHPIIPSSGH